MCSRGCNVYSMCRMCFVLLQGSQIVTWLLSKAFFYFSKSHIRMVSMELSWAFCLILGTTPHSGNMWMLHIWTSYPSSAPSIDRLLFCQDAFWRVQMFVRVCVAASRCVLYVRLYIVSMWISNHPLMWGPRGKKRWPTYSHVVVNVVTVTHSNFVLFF